MSSDQHRPPTTWKWVLLVLLIALVAGVAISWGWLGPRACTRLVTSSNQVLSKLGWLGLQGLGPQAVPYVIQDLQQRGRAQLWSISRGDGLAKFVAANWQFLSPEQLEEAAPLLLQVELVTRRYYVRGKPIAYDVLQHAVLGLDACHDFVERGEVLEGDEVVASYAMTWAGEALGAPPTGWRTILRASPPGVRSARDGSLVAPGSDAVAKRLQAAGTHNLRISVYLVDDRLSEPLLVGEVTQTITTVASLPDGYFVPVSDPETDRAMKDSLVVEVRVKAMGDQVEFNLSRRGMRLPAAFAGRVVVRVRETGQEVDLGREFSIPAGSWRLLPGRVGISELLPEPGRTYHVQVVLKPDLDCAWLDPTITEYWDGEVASEWLEVGPPPPGQEVERWLKEQPRGALRVQHLLPEVAQAMEKEWEEEWHDWREYGRKIPEVGTRLRKILQAEDDPERRASLVHALGVVGDTESVPLLMGILESPSEDVSVRASAAIFLPALVCADAQKAGQLGELLLRVLESESEDWTLRSAAANGLAILGDPAAVEPLGKVLLGDGDERVREAASRALALFGGPKAKAYLEQALNDESELVRESVAEDPPAGGPR